MLARQCGSFLASIKERVLKNFSLNIPIFFLCEKKSIKIQKNKTQKVNKMYRLIWLSIRYEYILTLF